MNKQQLLDIARKAQTYGDCIDGMVSAEVGAKYHAFIALLCQAVEAKYFVELGAYIGETTKYVAEFNPNCKILAIDINPDAQKQIMEKEPTFPNVKAITADSAMFHQHYSGEPIDVLFIDANHDFSLTMTNYANWKPFVKHGGLILIDDLHLDAEMKRFHEEVDQTVIDIPNVHATGFGVIINA